MGSTADLLVRLDVVDEDGVNKVHAEDFVESLEVYLANGTRAPLSLAAGNNAVAVPDGARGLILRFLDGDAPDLILKGANADTGIVIATGGVPDHPILIPLGDAPTIVINSTDDVECEAVWF